LLQVLLNVTSSSLALVTWKSLAPSLSSFQPPADTTSKE
jgi:hypothetical protein